MVLKTRDCAAVWCTSRPQADYVKHAWPGAWINTLFRNESPVLSSSLIEEAVRTTRYFWEPPEQGIVTFVDPTKVAGVLRRGEKLFGYCYLKAGWQHVGFTKGGLWAWQLLPENMPPPLRPQGYQEGFGVFPPSPKRR